MKKLVAIGVGLTVAAVLAYWFGFRDRGGAARTPVATQPKDDPWNAPAAGRAARRDASEAPTGPMPKLAFEVDPDGPLRLEGLVLDEHEQPVPAAEVRISSSPGRTTKTDSDGSFSFDKLLGRTYVVRARAGDKIGRATAKATARAEPVVIRLAPGTALTVTVIDGASRAPIAGATVLRLDSEDEQTTTDARGQATLHGLDDGWVQVVASAPGYGPATGSKGVGQGDKQVSLELALTKGAAVSGRVVDEAGQAVAGARVWATDASNAWEGSAGERLAQTTGKDGGFTLPALSAGSYLFFAKDETHAPAVTAPVAVAGEQPTTGVEIVMKAAAVVAGVVIDRDRQPVPYATVTLSSKQYSAGMTYRQAAADDKGRFVVTGLPRAALRLRAEGEEASSAVVDVDLAATPERRDLELVLDRTGTIAGVVVDGDGEPVAEATVTAFPDFLAGQVDFVLASTATATTDGGGRFTLRGLEDGSYRLWAERQGGGGKSRTDNMGVAARTGATDVKLVLPAPGGIEGTIALEGGEPPPLAIVSVDWQHRVTVRDGKFALGDLQPGTYDLRVVGPDFAERIKADLEVKAGKVTDAGTITVRPGRKIAGKVVDAKGAPVEGARVMYGKMLFGDGKQTGSDDADTASQMGMRTATSNAAGEFVINGAPRTSGSLLAEHTVRGRSVALKLPAGKDDVRGVTVTLRGYGAVAGKVTRKGQPVAGATVNASPVGASGQAIFVQTGEDGSFVIDKLSEGPTSLNAFSQKGMMGMAGGARTITVVAGQRIDGSIELPAGDVALTVKLEPKPGEIVNFAQVFLFRGVVAPKTGEALMDAFLSSASVEGAQGDSTLAVSGAAGMLFWMGPQVGSFPSFEELTPGSYSACVIPITGSITDQQLMQRIMANLDKLEVVCKPVTVAPTPAKQETTMVVPAMKPLPPAEDDES